MRETMTITKMIRPNAFAVLNPLRTFSPFMDMTKIHTKNAIATSASRPTYPKTGIISEKISSSSVSEDIRYDGSIATSEPHMRKTNPDIMIINGITGTYT